MNQTEILKEARRLHTLGYAIHWLLPKSKRPVESGWTTGPRKEWDDLKKSFKPDFNTGARLGTPSKIGDHYLCVIDVDIKSTKKEHRAEAIRALKKLIGSAKCPEVRTGRGNGSRHCYCVTASPFKTYNPAQSEEMVRVLMPSKAPSKREKDELTEKEIKAGWRISHAWEISLYSDGRQVVLPPSIHPDTNAPYFWHVPFSCADDLPVIEFSKAEKLESKTSNSERGEARGVQEGVDDFKVDETLDIRWLAGVPDNTRALIVKGLWKGTITNDRSAMLLPATRGLCSAGLDKNGILTVLTDKSTYLGECAYDHAKTTNRKRAAQWLWNYTVKKIMHERDPKAVFRGQMEEKRDWRKSLTRTGAKGDGQPKSSIENVNLVLLNAVSPSVFKRDTFAFRDTYGVDTPWGGKTGNLLTDDDVPKIKLWLGENYKFEPSKEVISDSMTIVASQNSFDPIKDWLDNLPAWDRVPRLNTWLAKHFSAQGDSEYLAQVFRKWLVAMVIRGGYKPGVKFDWLPIFEGAQGIGKSSFGRLLVGDKYFLDSLPNLIDKDSALALQGIWGVEIGELASFKKNEIEVVKAYITRTADKVRPPYGKRWIEIQRRCVFYGTTNRNEYLRDESGNRRFKPVEVGQLDFDALKRDRIQLFAEAKHLFNSLAENETTLELSGKAKEFELLIQAEKTMPDDSKIMEELLREFFAQVEGEHKNVRSFDFTKIKICKLFDGPPLGSNFKLNNWNTQLAAAALKRLGARKRHCQGRSVWEIRSKGWE